MEMNNLTERGSTEVRGCAGGREGGEVVVGRERERGGVEGNVKRS